VVEGCAQTRSRFSLATVALLAKPGFIQPPAGGYYILEDRAMDEMVLFMVATKIYKPSYISLESAFAYYGVIPETVFGVTSVSSRNTKQYESAWGALATGHSSLNI
jgi:predicted transcriptional regulator of viral defense system